MYRVTIQTLTGNENTIYYPGNDEYTLVNATLDLKVGSAGEFEFTIPINHPRYDEIVQNSIITVYEDAKEVWRGDIREITQNFDKSSDVYCLEDLSWLGDETVTMTAYTNETYLQRFTNSLATYNANQNVKRQFTQGMLTSVTTTNTCNWKPEWGMTYLDCLRRFIADDGYLKIRRVTTGGVVTRYLDILRLEDYGQQATQSIRFGENLLDFVKDIDTTNFLNVLYPYGAETETELYGDQMARLEGTPIQNDASIAAFGRRARTVTFETESEATLNRLALAYLNRYSQPKLKIEVKAIDLGDIEAVNRLRIGDSVRIIATKFGIDQWEYITKQSIDLLNLANNRIELSSSVQIRTSLTSQMAEQAAMIEEQQTASSILNEAKANALRILNGENGGVIYFVNNDDNQIIEQRIMNNADIDQATKAWRWNINGLAYLSRTYPSDPWNVGVAITMDGAIVADYITTGILNADLIKAGIIADYSGKFSLNMNTGAIVMNNATLNSATIQGNITANSGYIGSSQYGFIIGDTQIWTVNGPSNISNTWSTGAYYGINGMTVNAGGSHTHVMGSEISTPMLYVKNFQYSSYGGSGRFYPNERSGEGELVLEGTYAARIIVMSMAGRYSYSDLGPVNGSDARFKHDIKQIDTDKLRMFFEFIKPVSFVFNTDTQNRVRYGVVAQELEFALEQSEIDKGVFVQEDKSTNEHYKSVAYSEFHGLELAAIKDLYQIVKEQQKQIDELKKEIQILKEEKDG